jgi:hypothetical protein
VSASDTLAQIRDDITTLLKSLDQPDATVDDLVDVGSVLSAIVVTATEATDEVKARLRAEALKTLNHAPGKAEFAAKVGHVIVTVPPPRMTLLDTADIAGLQTILGDEFGSFFEGKMAYAPRKDIAERIIALPEGPQRDALLAAVVEKEQTPRVAFSKV